ncbi:MULTISPECIES: class I SAM-dependent methyltransferase [Actinosynnema]|uniref:class I SAM-dependent methyltransferase n=1 Tax=Actinosynnema TaxID=40566 RepID=UPI0020A5C80B|nr:methyltransferase domain-containing protein [Actinosynnema pretiosum]MCP2097282.1 Methyltransferase domain-containing protein [Actinosynnema pretiosum]
MTADHAHHPRGRGDDPPPTTRGFTEKSQVGGVAAPVATPVDVAARARAFDRLHGARARTGLVAELYAEAMGRDHPHEVDAASSCDWPLLGLLVARLRMRPGGLLVDAGCGTGGIGLWLARALGARLLGLDLSPVAVAAATTRRTAFGLGEAAGFRVADLRSTGLDDGCAQAVVCVDALGATGDRAAALRELARLLAPGARLVVTRATRHDSAPDWARQAEQVGLVLEQVDERPGEPAMWQRLYRSWIAAEPRLRTALGDEAAEAMLTEARRTLPRLPGRRAVLLTLHHPLGASLQVGQVGAARIAPPVHRSDHRHPHGERNCT